MYMLVPFSKKNTVTEDAYHPQLGAHRLGVVVWVLDTHLVNRSIVCNRKSFSTEWEEITDHWSMFLMPFSLCDAAFRSYDSIELAPEREAWHSWYMS